MVRDQSDDHSGGVNLSSIALLQERFRQLQRMKELRQEKELLRTMSESDRHSPPISHVNSSSQLIRQTTFPGTQLKSLPPKPQCQLSLSLWPDSQNKVDHQGSRELRIMEGPSSDVGRSWLISDATKRVICTSSVKLERCAGSDIDTSLRL